MRRWNDALWFLAILVLLLFVCDVSRAARRLVLADEATTMPSDGDSCDIRRDYILKKLGDLVEYHCNQSTGQWEEKTGAGANPGGSNTEIQFNSSDSFAGATGALYNSSTKKTSLFNLNDTRFSSLFTGADTDARFDAAATDCGSNPCYVVIDPSESSGSAEGVRVTGIDDRVVLVDQRYDPITSTGQASYDNFFSWTTRYKTPELTVVRNLSNAYDDNWETSFSQRRLFWVNGGDYCDKSDAFGSSSFQTHTSTDTKCDGSWAKDSHRGSSFFTLSSGVGQDSAMFVEAHKHGWGDMAAIWLRAIMRGSSEALGDEGITGMRISLEDGGDPYVVREKIATSPSCSGNKCTLDWTSSSCTDCANGGMIGERRYAIRWKTSGGSAGELSQESAGTIAISNNTVTGTSTDFTGGTMCSTEGGDCFWDQYHDWADNNCSGGFCTIGGAACSTDKDCVARSAAGNHYGVSQYCLIVDEDENDCSCAVFTGKNATCIEASDYTGTECSDRPYRLVFPIIEVTADDALKIGTMVQGSNKSYWGFGTTGETFKIYPCSIVLKTDWDDDIETNTAGWGNGTLVTEGWSGWATDEIMEIQPGTVAFGEGLKILQNMRIPHYLRSLSGYDGIQLQAQTEAYGGGTIGGEGVDVRDSWQRMIDGRNGHFSAEAIRTGDVKKGIQFFNMPINSAENWRYASKGVGTSIEWQWCDGSWLTDSPANDYCNLPTANRRYADILLENDTGDFVFRPGKAGSNYGDKVMLDETGHWHKDLTGSEAYQEITHLVYHTTSEPTNPSEFAIWIDSDVDDSAADAVYFNIQDASNNWEWVHVVTNE